MLGKKLLLSNYLKLKDNFTKKIIEIKKMINIKEEILNNYYNLQLNYITTNDIYNTKYKNIEIKNNKNELLIKIKDNEKLIIEEQKEIEELKNNILNIMNEIEELNKEIEELNKEIEEYNYIKLKKEIEDLKNNKINYISKSIINKFKKEFNNILTNNIIDEINKLKIKDKFEIKRVSLSKKNIKLIIENTNQFINNICCELENKEIIQEFLENNYDEFKINSSHRYYKEL